MESFGAEWDSAAQYRNRHLIELVTILKGVR